jgi:hypothetical protein
VGADTIKHVAKICKRVDITKLAACYQAINGSGSFSTGVTSGEEPILSPDGNDPQNTLSKIVHLRRQIHLM